MLIKHLQEQIDANKATLEQIQELVKAGAVVTKVESDNAGGIYLTLSDGTKHHITKVVQGEKVEQVTQGEHGIQGPEGPI